MKTAIRFVIIIVALNIATGLHAQKSARHKQVIVDSSSYFEDGFKVKNFHADVYVNKNGYFDIVENYDLQFIQNFKHGIFRTLPLNYAMTDTGGAISYKTIEIDSVDVPGRQFTQNVSDGVLSIKIGSPYEYVTGWQQYTIKYRVKYAFFYKETSTDFYWNFIGSSWNTIFEKASFSIHLPGNLRLANYNYFVYTGKDGHEDSLASIAYDYGAVSGEVRKKLPEHDQLTVLINLPKGYIYEPSALVIFTSKYGWQLMTIAFIITYALYYRLVHRNKKLLNVVEYEPPSGIDSAVAGYFVENKTDSIELVSPLPYWGANGYITITQTQDTIIGEDSILRKIKDLPDDKPPYAATIFNRLFLLKDEVSVHGLKDRFYDAMEDTKVELQASVQSAGYFAKQTDRAVLPTVLIFLIISIIGGIYIWHVFDKVAIYVWAAVCWLCLIHASARAIRRSDKGNEEMQQINGFKMFIEKAEKERIELLLKDNPSYFENTVAYALAFGMLDTWAEKFNDLCVEPPKWYNGAGEYAFTPQLFVTNLRYSVSYIHANITSRPAPVISSSSSGTHYSSGGYSRDSGSSSHSSGGGRHSGGGFGGGGGGSW